VPIEDFTTSPRADHGVHCRQERFHLSPLRLLELEGAADLADELFRAYMKQILVDASHADPHPEMCFLTGRQPDCLISISAGFSINEKFQEKLLQLLLQSARVECDEAAESRSGWASQNPILIRLIISIESPA